MEAPSCLSPAGRSDCESTKSIRALQLAIQKSKSELERCKELQENSRDHDESPIGEYAANDPLPKGRIGWSAHGRLMLTVLGGLAEFERELIRSRTSEGRERAKAKGVVMGRKPKLTHHQRQEAIARRDAGEPLVDIGRSYNVSHSTISRL
jgi:hypothetical protein